MKPPVLQTHHLSVGYTVPRRAAKVVLDDVNVSLYPSEFVCMVGPNGVGKSTLLRAVAGVQRPLSGHIELLGTDIQQMTPTEKARHLSVVLTVRVDVGLLSAYTLVGLGRFPHTNWIGWLSPHDEAVVRKAIVAVGADALANHPVSELSDGERQRIMIARALAQEPALMLLDEPTAFLDVPHRVEMMRLLRDLAHETGCAVLLSTHDLDLALRTADSIWLIANGKLTAGAPEDLVLTGAFEAAFNNKGIAFDRHSGAFNIGKQQVGVVALCGDEGIVRTWTCRALERAGFVIDLIAAPDNDSQCAMSQPTIQIAGDEANPQWRLQMNNQETIHNTLGKLLAALRNAE